MSDLQFRNLSLKSLASQSSLLKTQVLTKTENENNSVESFLSNLGARPFIIILIFFLTICYTHFINKTNFQ